jgi:hypothetical protein
MSHGILYVYCIVNNEEDDERILGVTLNRLLVFPGLGFQGKNLCVCVCVCVPLYLFFY